MRQAVLFFVALVAWTVASASAQASIITRDSTGYAGNPAWVNGGRPMETYVNGGNYSVTGLRGLNLTQTSSVDNICGVMASTNPNFNWVTNIQSIRLNIFSSAQAFAANPLLGDVYSTTNVNIGNLVGTAPPLWGGNNVAGWNNRWVDLDFSPFTLPSGNYITSVLFTINSGFLSWTETVHDFGLPGDIAALSLAPGQFFEVSTNPNYTTGDAAVMFEVTPVPTPGSGVLLAVAAWFGALGGRRRFR